MGIERQTERERDGYRERATNQKIWVEKERACTYVQALVEGNNKKIEKIDYLNKRGDRIDELMQVFCKNECVKQKKQVFSVKMDV